MKETRSKLYDVTKTNIYKSQCLAAVLDSNTPSIMSSVTDK